MEDCKTCPHTSKCPLYIKGGRYDRGKLIQKPKKLLMPREFFKMLNNTLSMRDIARGKKNVINAEDMEIYRED